MDSLHPSDDYSHRFFIWHEWIQVFGNLVYTIDHNAIQANGPLTAENVFEYFTTSMFYDKQSNNQVLRMQTMHTGTAIANEPEELKRFTGVEFAVVHSEPPSFFIVHKRERLSPDEVRPLAAYFVMNNRIYQSPDVYTVLSNRLLTSLCSLQTSLDILRSRRPDYIPRTGFVWPIVDSSSTPQTTEDLKKKGGEGSHPETRGDSEAPATEASKATPQRHQNGMLLMNAMRATALHSKTSFSAHVLEATNAEGAPDSPSAVRKSATPAPPPAAKAPAVAPAVADPPPKSLPGAGKKKRKRTLQAPPTS
ncbi:MED6-domain-containing protein [Mycena amicta]|nr:MED6-domain-containing protein [Mycena amicta]